MSGLLTALFSSLLALDPAARLDLPAGADPNDYVQATWMVPSTVAQVRVPAWQRYWRGYETELPAEPRWIRHTTGPRETLGRIAARYGVEVEHLREWNPITLDGSRRFVAEGKSLRIKATRIPPERHAISYVVAEGDTWETIAVDHRVDVWDLKVINGGAEDDSMTPLEVGRTLTVWVDPAIDWTVFREPGVAMDPAWLEIPDTALSYGHPNRGRIKGEPVLLPEIPQLYTRRFERIAHGSSHAIRTIVLAFANFRHDTGYAGEILVGSIARPNGGRFPPHKSHQSGRDVDIRLPLLPWFETCPTCLDPRAEEIDWRATWALIDAFLATGEVEMIFLDHKLQRPLYYAALSLGATPEELDEIISWPRKDGKGKKIIRHARGHDGHIHVRIRCGEAEPGCRTHRRSKAAP